MTTPNSTYTQALLALRDQLSLTRFADRPRLARELDRLFARRNAPAEPDGAIANVRQSVETSIAQVERLKALPLRVEYDPALPITAHRDEIAKALQTNQLVVVCGATGSGKTTQLPKICMEAGRGTFAQSPLDWRKNSARLSAVPSATKCASTIAPARIAA
jgi:ATP-dependent helicase HrpA